MEAVWKIEVEDFPAFMVVDDKGNDFFKKWAGEVETPAEQDSHFDEMKDFFYGIDANQDGVLTYDEIAKVFNMSASEAQSLLQEFDVDKDGRIDIMEFELMILKNEKVREKFLEGLDED